MIMFSSNPIIPFTLLFFLSSTIALPTPDTSHTLHYEHLEVRGSRCPGGGIGPCVCGGSGGKQAVGLRQKTLHCPDRGAVYVHDNDPRIGSLTYKKVCSPNCLHGYIKD